MPRLEDDPMIDERADERMWEETGLTEEIVAQLSRPFPEGAIGWKPQAFNRDRTRALAIPYITSRHVMDRLDGVVGPANWEYDFDELNQGVKGKLAVFGITKSDRGYVSGDDEAGIKGSVSDGLKRAAVLFGIGRYLYDAEQQWVEWDDQHRKFAEKPRLILKTPPSQGQQPQRESRYEPEVTDALLEKAKELGGVPQEIPQTPTKRTATIEDIIAEVNGHLEARGYSAHYRNRPHVISAMRMYEYNETTQAYLGKHFADIVAVLVDHAMASQEAKKE